MKQLTLFSIIAALILSISACKNTKEGTYTINGSITGQDTGWIFLKKREEGKWITSDSTKLKEGKFTFTGKIGLPELYYLMVEGREGAFPFFIENAVLTVNAFADSLEKSEMNGSKAQETYKSYLKQDELYNKKLEDLYNRYMAARDANDTVQLHSAEAGFDAIEKQQTAAMKDFILRNGKSVVSAYLALSNAYNFDLENLKEINKALDPSISESNYVKKLKEREEILTSLLPGNVAPDIVMKDTSGKELKLSSLRGKVVLVDFWASWCSPCRAENPNVVAAFGKYNAKGFTVFGVSLDREKGKWIEAINKDGLTWSHVSDLKGWDCAAAKQYGVMSIPSNFLLDKEGKILGSGLRGEDLTKKLEEVMGK